MITRRLARPLAAWSSSAWTCPSCIQQTRTALVNPRITAAVSSRLPSQTRSLHMPPLAHEETFANEGVRNLLSPTGFNIAWLQYQNMMIQKLNELTAGEAWEHQDPKKIILRFARDPLNASLFNHASMAHNNHFFFSTLSTQPLSLDTTPRLKTSLTETFGSIDTLRTTMLDTAQALFGPGFVWLVWAYDVPAAGGVTTRKGDWRILTTYLAGTPYPEAGFRQQGVDMSTGSEGGGPYAGQQPVNNAGRFGPFSAAGKEAAKLPPGATRIIPALCVNTWEHVYIRDYGLAGKRKFLEDWWEVVDWSKVELNVPRTDWQAPTFYGGR